MIFSQRSKESIQIFAVHLSLALACIAKIPRVCAYAPLERRIRMKRVLCSNDTTVASDADIVWLLVHMQCAISIGEPLNGLTGWIAI